LFRRPEIDIITSITFRLILLHPGPLPPGFFFYTGLPNFLYRHYLEYFIDIHIFNPYYLVKKTYHMWSYNTLWASATRRHLYRLVTWILNHPIWETILPASHYEHQINLDLNNDDVQQRKIITSKMINTLPLFFHLLPPYWCF